jgi:hypothetical protein
VEYNDWIIRVMTKQEIIIGKTLKQILIISIQNKGFINRQTSDSFRYIASLTEGGENRRRKGLELFELA